MVHRQCCSKPDSVISWLLPANSFDLALVRVRYINKTQASFIMQYSQIIEVVLFVCF